MAPIPMSGLQMLRAAAAGELPHAPMWTTTPMRAELIEAGYVKVTARADERHLNSQGAVHGGFVATVLDTVTGCAVHTMLDAGVGYATIDLNVKMLRPAPQSVDLIAEGKVVHLSRSLGVAEGVLSTADGKKIALATATCFIRRADAAR
ncbi:MULTISPECIES: PaaI family thioesterase [Burkholderia]|uniref:PaaI family thioesterase n=1 Tax=Burkholderia TaxID=32008 RepID=UPI00084127EB|nr:MULTISPECIES: PaaI family thioesterase [unclassified Burkholderia]AOK31204.1 phenylacetic acid degradation protein [Burkholderia sp. Bp7605]